MIKNLILSAWLAAALSPLASLASPVDLESAPAAAAVDITSLTVKGESCQSHSTTLAPTGDVGTLGFDFFIATSGSLSCTVEVGFSFTGARNSDSTDISVDVTSHGFANLVSGLTGTVTQTVSVSGSNDVKRAEKTVRGTSGVITLDTNLKFKTQSSSNKQGRGTLKIDLTGKVTGSASGGGTISVDDLTFTLK